MDNKKIIFIDRDGTLVDPPSDQRVDSPDKLKLFPDTITALRLLAAHGYSIVIVTNQTGITEGRFTLEVYKQINKRLMELLAPSGIKVLKIYTCPHLKTDNCLCRKPRPKMVSDAVNEFNIDLSSAYMVGDRQDDVDLGRNAGVKTILVETGPFPVKSEYADVETDNLLEAAGYIVSHSERS